MAKKPINYTSRDFSSIKNDLMNYAKRYYPSTFQDFNEASFGALMLDLVAYVGDQLSFYVDYQANESFLESSLELKNIVRLSKQMGYKNPGAAKATGEVSFFIEVPSSATTLGPDTSYIPILKAGTTLTSAGGAVYTLVENVDFSDPDNEITVSKVNSSNGIPTYFAIKSYGKIISGEQYTETVGVGDYERFLRIKVPRTEISEVLSVTDQEGNPYYEVDYLSQDIVYKEIPNYADNKIAVPFKLRAIPAPRRFTVEHDEVGDTYIQFGFGSAENLTKDVIADPADVVLDVTGRNYIVDGTFDPSNLNESDKFGVVPTHTSLFITFTANSGPNINAPVGTITETGNTSFAFANSATLATDALAAVISSLEVNNATPILGDTAPLSAEEIRTRAFATFATQSRAVSRSDYINLAYRMPSKFGRLKRVNIIQDQSSFKRNLNMYVLAENSKGNFVEANSTLKENLKQWLEPRRMLNDTIDILNGKIINYGIRFEVLADLDVNRYTLVDACINAIVENNLNVKLNIGDAVYISDLYKILNDVPGVTDTTNIELVNKAGGLYSNYVYNINRNLSDDGRFLVVPENSVAEVLYPNVDIVGVVK